METITEFLGNGLPHGPEQWITAVVTILAAVVSALWGKRQKNPK